MKEITAPMAGTVLKLLVEDGDNVAEGQELLILESMKMEIPIESTWNSSVFNIRVSKGDFVNEGDVLIVLN